VRLSLPTGDFLVTPLIVSMENDDVKKVGTNNGPEQLIVHEDHRRTIVFDSEHERVFIPSTVRRVI